MPQTPGISSCNYTEQDKVVTSSTAPSSTNLFWIAAPNTRYKYRYFLPINVGATGGVRATMSFANAPANFHGTFTLNNTGAPSVVIAATTNPALVFTNALANAGDHWMIIEGVVEFGATAGSCNLLMAQNTSDALSLTLAKGAFLELIQF